MVSSYHELQIGINTLQHIQGLFVFFQMTDHGQVTAVEKHIRLG
jgi:hypothetical protein